ncbi:SWIM zinc finger family protein [Flavobacterium sp. LS1R49]|uniref:SWIM zinc finger family protein n=1 Tax=Flavobacterium shii TaxID=2987687 RepID=A0A9X3BZ39_9FLAO|nr:DUF6880 family protein [Flavobacterium shii]MCV9929695.1 SWIM zinc finger family protein [Flavobacterium shii]
MTLQNFEKQIDSKILKRGKEYFNDGNVEFIEETEKNIWEADVFGTDDYHVKIELGAKNEIKEWECDCPYDYGDICKHVIAVLYKVLEQKTMDVASGEVIEKTAKKEKFTFDTLLNKIEIKEYQNFIKYYSGINKNFKDEFTIYFSEKDESFDLEQKFTEQIKKTIKTYTYRGFVDYHASNKLGKELNHYLDTVNSYLSKNNFRDASTIIKIIIKEVSAVFEYCDDSNGYISDSLNSAIEQLYQISKAPASIEFKNQIAVFLKMELQKKIYFNYGDTGCDLTNLFGELCITISKTDDFIQFLDAKIESSKKDDYNQKFFIETKISFLIKLGKKIEIEDLIQQNLEVPEIRALEIDRVIKEKNYEKAKKLLADGIKIAENKHHKGTVMKWEKILLQIAVLEKDINMERYFSRKFAFDSNTFSAEYYVQWKKTFIKEEWTETIEKVIKAIIEKVKESNKNNSFYNHQILLFHLAPIYIQENYLDRLLQLVQKQNRLDTILIYQSYLIKEYPNELFAVYVPAIEAAGDYANGRAQYKSLATTMKKIIKDFPDKKESILEIAHKLKIKYPRRPAMIEELNKI